MENFTEGPGMENYSSGLKSLGYKSTSPATFGEPTVEIRKAKALYPK